MIESINIDTAKMEFPQAYNCMVFFKRKILNSLSDEVTSNVWIAGGCIRNYFEMSKNDTDIDFFSNDRKYLSTLVRELRNKLEFKHYIITKHAIKGYVIKNGVKIKVDIVKRVFSNQIDTIENFDFTVCCFSTNGTEFHYNRNAPFDILRKRLVINSLPKPVDTLKRLQRYINKGYFACNGTLLTISKEIAKMDPNSEIDFEFYTFD